MVGCGICKHYSEGYPCSFFRLPSDKVIRKKWVKIITKEVCAAYKEVKICSCHFVDGSKKNLPTINIPKKSPKPENVYAPFPKYKPRGLYAKRRKLAELDENVAMHESLVEGQRESVNSVHEIVEIKEEREEIWEEIDEESLNNEEETAEIEEETEEIEEETEEIDNETVEIENVTTEIWDQTENIEEQPSTSLSNQTIVIVSSQAEAENYFLKKENEQLKLEIQNRSFSFKHIKDDNSQITFYTGLPSAEDFIKIIDLIKPFQKDIKYFRKWNVNNVCLEDQVLITLMKLRLNLLNQDLAYRFNISTATVSNIFITFLYVLHTRLYKILMAKIPPSPYFTNCRIVLDCTEIVSDTPKDVKKLQNSSHKQRHTWKILIGVCPNGVINFISDAYTGSTSNKEIVQLSGVLNQMEEGDLILAGKGFSISDILPDGVHLNNFSSEEDKIPENISNAHLHVARAIYSIKSYRILNLIPHTLNKHVDAIVQTIGVLVNFQYPLIIENVIS